MGNDEGSGKFDFKRLSAALKTRGAYAALMGLICFGALAALITLGEAENVPPAQSPAPNVGSVSRSDDERLEEALFTPTPSASPAGAKQAEASPSPTVTPIPDFTPEAVTPTAKTQAEKASPPVSGRLIWKYAVNELIYSSTLDQWMTHSGVDIAAAKGSPVYAVFGGVVESVDEDDLLGVTVTITHDNALMSVYANLADEPPVSIGARVNAHDEIGLVGDTAISESEAESHLHFELYKDGVSVDPDEYVMFERDG